MGMDRLLVGRDAECASLRAGLAAALAGPGFVILVTGEGGAGKTTLVEHVLACTSTPVLCGRAAEWTGTAYDVVARALRPAVRNAAGPVPGLLAQIMPELGAPPPEPEPAALAAAVCSVLAGIAGDKPLALFLERWDRNMSERGHGASDLRVAGSAQGAFTASKLLLPCVVPG